MADILNPVAWSEIDNSNGSGIQPSWPENMLGMNVNNAARAMQGALKRMADQHNATVVTTGTGSAYVVAYPVAPESLYNGQRFLILAHTPCAAAPTLNINSLGAKEIKKLTGSGVTAVSASDIFINCVLDLIYIVALNQFLWINPPYIASGGPGTIAISDVTGLTAALAAKADVAALNTAIATEIASPHTAGYTLLATDAGKMVAFDNTTAMVCTVNSSVFAVNSRVDIIQLNTGQVSFGGTATLASSGGKTKLTGRYSAATIWFPASSSSYVLFGDISV